MKKLFAAFLVFAASAVFAQSNGVEDTIRVASLQRFNAPSVGAIIVQNVLKFDFQAEILDANRNKIRDVKEYTQRPKKEEFAKKTQGGRGTTVSLVIHETIDKPGIYYLRVGVTATGEVGGSAKKDYLYAIMVDYPKVLSAVNLRKNYYFSEKEAFSFATAEYTDANAYSYRIFDGATIVDSGRGSMLRLDKVLSDINNVGKSLSLKGYYQGNEIQYKTLFSDSVFSSSWDISVQKPNLDEFNGWKSKADPEWMVSVYNNFSKSFLFIYLGATPSGGFVVVRPDARNISVKAEPEGFLKGSGFNTRKQGSFFYIDLDVNDDYIQEMKETEVAVKVTISFRTQFGESVKRDYYAVVIK